MTGTVVTNRTGSVLRVGIDSAQRLNAMSLAMWQQLRQVVDAAHADPDVRVVLLRGVGEKAFVSGADISEFASRRADPAGVAAYEVAVAAAQDALMACRHPVVASIRGVCMGGGLGLALACDLRYAAADAKFRMPAARLGLGYSLDGMRRFVDILGPARTAEMFFTARTVDADEAHRIGLVHATYASDMHDAQVEQAIAVLAGNAPLTLRAAKAAITAVRGHRRAEVHEAGTVQEVIAACMRSADYIEGRDAFAEKRTPRFTGR